MYTSSAPSIFRSLRASMSSSLLYFFHLAVLFLSPASSMSCKHSSSLWFEFCDCVSFGETEAFWLNDQVSQRIAALLARQFLILRLLSHREFGHCNLMEVAGHTYPNPLSYLIIMTQSCDYGTIITFIQPICMLVKGCCEVFNRPKMKANGGKTC